MLFCCSWLFIMHQIDRLCVRNAIGETMKGMRIALGALLACSLLSLIHIYRMYFPVAGSFPRWCLIL